MDGKNNQSYLGRSLSNSFSQVFVLPYWRNWSQQPPKAEKAEKEYLHDGFKGKKEKENGNRENN